RIFVIRGGKAVNVFPAACDDFSLSPDGRWLVVLNDETLKLFDVAGGLRWTFTADEVLRTPRFDRASNRLAVGSELGTLYAFDTAGTVLLERDLGALPAPAWLGDGGLVAATWLGQLVRLDASFNTVWSKTIRPDVCIAPEKLLAVDPGPVVRKSDWGNAA